MIDPQWVDHTKPLSWVLNLVALRYYYVTQICQEGERELKGDGRFLFDCEAETSIAMLSNFETNWKS